MQKLNQGLSLTAFCYPKNRQLFASRKSYNSITCPSTLKLLPLLELCERRFMYFRCISISVLYLQVSIKSTSFISDITWP